MADSVPGPSRHLVVRLVLSFLKEERRGGDSNPSKSVLCAELIEDKMKGLLLYAPQSKSDKSPFTRHVMTSIWVHFFFGVYID